MKVIIFLGLVAFSQQCCLLDKYTAFVESVIGTSNGANPGTLEKMTGDFYSDATRKMVVYIGVDDYNGTPVKFKSIQDFNTHVMYTIISGKCTKIPTIVAGMFDNQCLKDSWLKRSGYIGREIVHTYEIPMPDGTFHSLSVDDNCVLVDAVRTFGTSLQTSRYYNVTAGVDPSVFVVPSSCNNQ